MDADVSTETDADEGTDGPAGRVTGRVFMLPGVETHVNLEQLTLLVGGTFCSPGSTGSRSYPG